MSTASTGRFPDQPAPAQLIQMAAHGLWGGPTYSYREARIECCPGGHVCGLFMPEHPLYGMSFGVAGTVTSLVDLWADAARLPSYMRAGVKRRA